ncbi:MAG: dTDP-4-dehydrorhamnose 3,5-epimerase family protein [Gammaproteobacteria bacterium]|nr:dTDP-4-dehydrorhamnose 3,5-epimerase family protein [Gammaproteobacteria bacterium]
MLFEPLGVAGCYIVSWEPRTDARGSFGRVFCAETFASRGLETAVVQANFATTRHAGTVRGLHYQLPPSAEAKLIRCTTGAILDAVVDTRSDSPSFGRWTAAELIAGDGTAVYVPPGCAHGYQALEDDSQVYYQVSAAYDPERERGINHADPDLSIVWALPPVHISEKDAALPPLADADLPEAR